MNRSPLCLLLIPLLVGCTAMRKAREAEAARAAAATRPAIPTTALTSVPPPPVEPSEMVFEGTPFEEALARIAEPHVPSVTVRWDFLAAAGVGPKSPVRLVLKRTTLRDALHQLLDRVGGARVKLAFERTSQTSILITTRDDYLSRNVVTCEYDVRELLLRLPDNDPRPREQLIGEFIKLIAETVDPPSWRRAEGLLCTMEAREGRLTVRQVPENQLRIAELYQQVIESNNVLDETVPAARD